jgi:hypothetical protein
MTTLALAPKNSPRMEIEIPEDGNDRPVTNPQAGPKLPVMMWVLPDANGLTFQSQVTFRL